MSTGQTDMTVSTGQTDSTVGEDSRDKTARMEEMTGWPEYDGMDWVAGTGQMGGRTAKTGQLNRRVKKGQLGQVNLERGQVG